MLLDFDGEGDRPSAALLVGVGRGGVGLAWQVLEASHGDRTRAIPQDLQVVPVGGGVHVQGDALTGGIRELAGVQPEFGLSGDLAWPLDGPAGY
ncbi:hypothetical protein ABT009_34050 [Streptomyces sp. NPDC002896]|uniref:hypothetical protein n=1 Tax=Streptomyces sp. NPDC002896 TaxID=3154438 RepID=UPI003319B360